MQKLQETIKKAEKKEKQVIISKKAENIRKIGQAIIDNEDNLKGLIITPKYLAEISDIGNSKTIIDIFREYEPLQGLGINVRETTGGKIVMELIDISSIEETNKRLKKIEDKINLLIENIGWS